MRKSNVKSWKRVAVFVFACFYSLTLMSGLAACKKNGNGGGLSEPAAIEVIESPFEYHVGDTLDAFDHFKKTAGQNYSFTIKKSGEESEVMEGNTYWFAQAGEYELTGTAARGKTSDSKKVDISVTENAPYMLIQNPSVNVDLYDTMSMARVVSLAGPLIMSDADHEEYIESVVLYDTEDGRKIDIKKGEAAGNGLFDGRLFHFIVECDCLFTVVSETSGGKSAGEFTVTVRENFDNLEELDCNITYDSQTRSASWNTVDGAKEYYVKIDRKAITVPAPAEGNTLSIDFEPHLVSEFQYFDFVVVPVNENGERMGKDVYKDIVIAPEGSEGVVKGVGASIDATTRTATLKGKESYTAGWDTGIHSFDNSYIGFCGDYGVGTYVSFTFTGNNLPQVMFFADKFNGDMTFKGGTGWLLMNGLYATTAARTIGDNKLVAVGPDRFHGDDHTNYITVSEHRTKHDVSKDTLLTQAELKKDSSGRTYKYVVGTYAHKTVIKGKTVEELAIETLLYDNSNLSKPIVAEHYYTGIQISGTDENDEEIVPPSGKIVAYAAVKGDGKDTEFKYDLPETPSRAPLVAPGSDGNSGTAAGSDIENVHVIAGDGAQIDRDSKTVTLPGVESYSAGNVGGVGKMYDSYVGFNYNYGVGAYVDFTFTGNNLPQVMFFADDFNGNLADSGGEGWILMNGLYSTTDKKVWNGDRLSCIGPDRINDNYRTVTNRLSSIISQNSLFTYDELSKAENADKKFKYTVGTFIYNEKLAFEVLLYDGITEKLLAGEHYISTTPAASVRAGRIIAYGGVKGKDNPTVFGYSLPIMRQNAEPLFAHVPGFDLNSILEPSVDSGSVDVVLGNGATANGREVTLPGVISASTGAQSGVSAMYNSYVGFNYNYEVGTYVDFTFTGNNLPQVMFFADNFNGNMSYEGGSGYVFTNGICVSGGGKRIVAGNKLVASLNNRINQHLQNHYENTTTYDVSAGTLFAQNELSKPENENREFVYTVGSYEDNGKVAFEFILKDASTGVICAYATKITADSSDGVKGRIVAFGCVKGTDKPTTFKYSMPRRGSPSVVVTGSNTTMNNDGTVTVAGCAASNAAASGIRSINNGYVAFNDNYGVGTYVDFTFTGNNMPQVMFFADSIEGNMSSHNGTAQDTSKKGWLLLNGHTQTDGTKNHSGSLILFGPNRIWGDANGLYARPLAKEGSGFALRIVAGSHFSQNALAENPNANYIYTAGSFDNDGYLAFEVILRDADNPTAEPLARATYTTDTLVSAVEEGKIVAYGAIKGTENPTTFAYGMPYRKTDSVSVITNSVTEIADGYVSLPGRTTDTNAGGTQINKSDYTYIPYDGNYRAGTYIDFEFTGNNLPQILFFADTLNGKIAVSGGNPTEYAGWMILNGMTDSTGAEHNLDLLVCSGPNRFYGNYAQITGTYSSYIVGNSKDTLFTQKSLAADDSGRTYIYTVGTYKNASGKLEFEFILRDKAAAEGTDPISRLTYATDQDADGVSGKIAVYAGLKGFDNPTVFKILNGGPYTKTASN